jgi:hypothetical protein
MNNMEQKTNAPLKMGVKMLQTDWKTPYYFFELSRSSGPRVGTYICIVLELENLKKLWKKI